jgi:hypothetical protein
MADLQQTGRRREGEGSAGQQHILQVDPVGGRELPDERAGIGRAANIDAELRGAVGDAAEQVDADALAKARRFTVKAPFACTVNVPARSISASSPAPGSCCGFQFSASAKLALCPPSQWNTAMLPPPVPVVVRHYWQRWRIPECRATKCGGRRSLPPVGRQASSSWRGLGRHPCLR